MNTPPTWTANEASKHRRKINRAQLILRLYLMSQAGTLDLSNKSALAMELGIHRHTLDRNLRMMHEAAKEAGVPPAMPQ